MSLVGLLVEWLIDLRRDESVAAWFFFLCIYFSSFFRAIDRVGNNAIKNTRFDPPAFSIPVTSRVPLLYVFLYFTLLVAGGEGAAIKG